MPLTKIELVRRVRIPFSVVVFWIGGNSMYSEYSWPILKLDCTMDPVEEPNWRDRGAVVGADLRFHLLLYLRANLWST